MDSVLPFDGECYLIKNFLDSSYAQIHFEKLLKTISWQHDELVLFGKQITTKRKVALYGEDALSYSYSGKTKTALAWTKELKNLKRFIEKHSKIDFNSCLINLYHDGTEGMSWHSDDEKELGKNPVIASLSLGSSRRFCFKHRKNGLKIEVLLESGDLLIMQGETQSHWLHALPKTTKVKDARINLTFRRILF